jgi:non-canonical purine NTP pyrophosphatase (RdgB/HAM1 family)
MSTPITFITGNAGKAEQLSKYLGIPVDHHKVDLTEIQSLDLSEIISHKAKEAYQQIKGPVIVDDVSLIIHSMGKLPGPFIKYFISEFGNEGICKAVSQYENKSATAEVCIGYYDGHHLEVFSGVIEGTISHEPLGNGGFGWDAIFIPDAYTQTRSEMSESDYDDTSPRKFALDKLRGYLTKER